MPKDEEASTNLNENESDYKKAHDKWVKDVLEPALAKHPERNKKFMISKLKKLLLKISNENVDTQLQKLKTEFELWKGNEEQIDDVCLMGVRII